jgi:hypothetical protein
MFGRGRSWIAWRKKLQTLRVPAGDPSDDCECVDLNILTESGEPLLSEQSEFVTTES